MRLNAGFALTKNEDITMQIYRNYGVKYENTPRSNGKKEKDKSKEKAK